LPVADASSPPAPADGVLVGEVVNALDNKPLAGATVKIAAAGKLAAPGPSAVTDNRGRFRIEKAPVGAAPVEISAADFSTEQVEPDVVLASGRETPLRVALSPASKVGQIRAVLTWGATPTDLDAHLQGPLPDGKQFHICSQQPGDLRSPGFPRLDVEAKSGYGPETITVGQTTPGTYHYCVHDYSHREYSQSTALAQADAVVKIYAGKQTYCFHTGGDSAGNVWDVCDIVVTGGGVEVKRIDRYEKRPALADLVFLLDVSPGVAEYLKSRTDKCIEKSRNLQAGRLDCRFAMIPFGSVAAGQKTLARTNLTADLKQFEAQMAPIDAGEAQPPKTAVDAMQQALALEFRPFAAVQFVLITNTSCTQAGELAPLGEALARRKITTTVYAEPAEEELYRPLYGKEGLFVKLEDKAPDVSPQVHAPDAKKGELGGGMQLGGIYRQRVDHDVKKVQELGGSQQSEDAVGMGLDWLARHQATDDGHWAPDCLQLRPGGCCEGGQPCDQGREAYPMAQTGLALLAFQAGGHFDFNENKYSANVARGLDWLVKNQNPEGALCTNVPNDVNGTNVPNLPRSKSRVGPRAMRFFSRDSRNFMYEHGIATFALAEACAIAKAANREANAHYLTAARKGVEFIEAQQHTDGGWRYSNSKDEPSDSSVSGWQVLALKTAKEAGIRVEPHTIARVEAFFKSLEQPGTGRTKYTHFQVGSDAMTGVGMLVHEFLLKKPDSPLVHQGAEHLAASAQGNGVRDDYYAIYNCTLAMFMAGGKSWETWNAVAREKLLQWQLKQGCLRGSWTPGDGMGAQGGRICCTAWAVLSLEVYYRFTREHADPAVPAVAEAPAK
jgi:hypothetical protein